MQSTHRMYPTTKCFTLYSTIRQTTVLRAALLHFPDPKSCLNSYIEPNLQEIIFGPIRVGLITQKQFWEL